jgi:hypothetical protein
MAVSLLDDVEIRDGWFQEHTGNALDKEGNRLRSGKVWVPQKLVEELRWPWVFAVLWTCAATSFVTDYLAPIAIGLLPPLYAGEQYIAGKVQTYLTPAPKKGAAPAAASGRRAPS